MRVVAGIYRSRIINAPKGMNTRPTMDKVKESMFSIIGPNINGAVCLDLFSGSGNLGIEALSRGASFVYFNDRNRSAYLTIQDNLESLNIKEDYSLTMLDYKKCLTLIDKKLDVVFLDPPYRDKIYEDIIMYLYNNKLLNDNCCVVCEADLNLKQFEIEGFSSKEYIYGNKKLLVFKS